MEERKKSKLGIIIIVLLLIALGVLGGYFLGSKAPKDDKCKKAPEPVKEPEKNENDGFEDLKEVTGQDLLSIYSIIDYEKDTVYQIFGYYTLEELPEGNINDLEKYQKEYIIYHYAVNNSMYYTIEGKNENDYCFAGSGYCDGVSRTDYEKIRKLFSISDTFDDLYSDYYIYKEKKNVGDIALYTYGGWVSPYTFKITKKDARYDGNMIILKEIIEVYDSEDEKLEKILNTKEVKFIFYKLDDGSYALHSIEKK